MLAALPLLLIAACPADPAPWDDPRLQCPPALFSELTSAEIDARDVARRTIRE